MDLVELVMLYLMKKIKIGAVTLLVGEIFSRDKKTNILTESPIYSYLHI